MRDLVVTLGSSLLLLALLIGPAHGQAVNGTLLGTITDSSGAAVPNVQITCTETNTGVNRKAVTSDVGTYVFSGLPPGVYSVAVELLGFKKEVRSRVEVQVNQTARVDVTLQPGAVTETLTVSAEAGLLQTDRSDTNQKIEAAALADLPISTPGGRNFQVLLNLVPGTSPAAFNHSQFFNAQSSLSTHVNGQSRLGNNLQFEGVDNNERTGLLQVLIPPIEALQTVDISTSNYEAELGRSVGAVTNIILKSGANQFHAQAYWYNRVSALSSRAFYDAARSHFVYNYVGGQVGGPIIKNKTFFFFDFLRQTDHRYSGDTYTLPTAAERSGDLSVSSVPIYDPATGNPDGSNRTPFAGNQIPANRIQAIPKKILGLVFLPTAPGLNNNFFELIPFVRNTNQWDIKGDHNATAKDRLAIRYSHSKPVTFDGPAFGTAGGPHGGGFQGTGTQATHDGAINYDRILSPTLLSQVRFGVSRYRNDAQQVDYGTSDSTTLGVPGVNTGDPFVSGMVGISVGNFSSPLIGYSASLPWIRAETNFVLVNTWTKTFSRHTIKWGGDLHRIRDDLLQTQTFGARGVFNYGVNQTSLLGQSNGNFGNSLASFLLDQPSSAGRDLPNVFPTHRVWQLFTYVSDKWQASEKLTVDLGLRWEFYPPMVSSHPIAGYSNYDPATNSLVLTGIGGNPENLGMVTRYHNFAPRIGLAYRLDPKTVLRVGFGLSYSPFPDNQYAHNNFPVAQNNPYSPNFTYGPTVLPNGQPMTLAGGFPAPAPFAIPSSGIITNAPDQSYNVINKNFKNPYVESWSFAVQRALPYNFSLDAAYVANHGVDQANNYNLNAATVLGQGINGQPLYVLFGRKSTTNFRYAGFNTSFQSLQMKLTHRFSGGFQITGSYTYGKALGYGGSDTGGLGGLAAFYINQRRNWHRLDFDQTHNFVLASVFELPFGQGKRWAKSDPVSRAVLGGWQLSGVFTFRTGTPMNFSGNSGVLNAPGNSNTLNYFGSGIQILNGTGRGAPWFSSTICSATVTTNCFAQPGNLQFGNLGLNVISGPNNWSLDLAVSRQFTIGERLKVQLRGENFSVTNTPQWNNPDTNIGNSTFGFITSAGGNRSVQLGTKVIW